MIDRIARLEIADAAAALYDVLLGPDHAAGSITVVPAERTRAVLAAGDLERTRQRLHRRGVQLTADGIVVNGLELGLVEAAEHPRPNADVVLDHMVVRTADAERAVAGYGGRLGIELRLERHAPQWGMHMLFFRCGEEILEIVQPLDDPPHTGADLLWGVTWRVRDLDATADRLRAAGVAIGEVRPGRKRGTRVCTVHDRRAGIRTLLIEQESLPFSNS